MVHSSRDGIMRAILGDTQEPGTFPTGGSLLSMEWIRAQYSFFLRHARQVKMLLKHSYDSVGLAWTLRDYSSD